MNKRILLALGVLFGITCFAASANAECCKSNCWNITVAGETTSHCLAPAPKPKQQKKAKKPVAIATVRQQASRPAKAVPVPTPSPVIAVDPTDQYACNIAQAPVDPIAMAIGLSWVCRQDGDLASDASGYTIQPTGWSHPLTWWGCEFRFRNKGVGTVETCKIEVRGYASRRDHVRLQTSLGEFLVFQEPGNGYRVVRFTPST